MKPQGFPEKLALYTRSKRLLPYAWGTHDCVTFAADWIVELRGTDPIAEIRGTWSDEETATTVLASAGGLIAAMDARFTRHPSKNEAQRGDIVLVPDGTGRMSLGICTGMHAAAPGDTEMLMVPMTEARLAWDV